MPSVPIRRARSTSKRSHSSRFSRMVATNAGKAKSSHDELLRTALQHPAPPLKTKYLTSAFIPAWQGLYTSWPHTRPDQRRSCTAMDSICNTAPAPPAHTLALVRAPCYALGSDLLRNSPDTFAEHVRRSSAVAATARRHPTPAFLGSAAPLDTRDLAIIPGVLRAASSCS